MRAPPKSSFPALPASNTFVLTLPPPDNPRHVPPEILPPGEILPPRGAAAPISQTQVFGEDPPFSFMDVIRVVLIAFIAFTIFGALALSIAAPILHLPARSPALVRDPRITVPAQAVAYAFVLMFMVVLAHGRGRPFWKAVRWDWPAMWARFAIIGVVLQIGIQVIGKLLPVPKQLPIDQYFTTITGAYLMAVLGTTFAPLMEELFFRGFLYPVLARRLGGAVSVLVTALLFALLHAAQLGYSWSPLLLLFLVGLVLTIIRAVTRSVAASFLIHAFYNATLFGVLYFGTNQFRNLEKMAG